MAIIADRDSGSIASVSKKIGILRDPIILGRTATMRKIRILNASLLVAIAAVAVAIMTQIW